MARRKRSGGPARCSRYAISKSALYTLFGYLESRLVTDTLKEKNRLMQTHDFEAQG